MSLHRRLQILIDDARYERLAGEAERTGASIGTLVRDAIDERYGSRWPSSEDAGRRLLEAEPMPVADWDVLKRELEDEIVDRHER